MIYIMVVKKTKKVTKKIGKKTEKNKKKPKFKVNSFVMVKDRKHLNQGMVGKVMGVSEIQPADPDVAIRLNKNGKKVVLRSKKLRIATKKEILDDPIKHKLDKVKLTQGEINKMNEPW